MKPINVNLDKLLFSDLYSGVIRQKIGNAFLASFLTMDEFDIFIQLEETVNFDLNDKFSDSVFTLIPNSV